MGGNEDTTHLSGDTAIAFESEKPIGDLETPTSQKTAKTFSSISEIEDGIDVPHFLQPLFGMNFVPFAQSNNRAEKETALQPKTRVPNLGENENGEEAAVNDGANKPQLPAAEDLDGFIKDSEKKMKSIKNKKKKKSLLRRVRKSLSGKNKKSTAKTLEGVNRNLYDSISIESKEKSTAKASDNVNKFVCDSSSLLSHQTSYDPNCEDKSVLTTESLDSIDRSIGSRMSKKSTKLRFFKPKRKQTTSASVSANDSKSSVPQSTFKWLQVQQSNLQNHHSEMLGVQSQIQTLQEKTTGIQKRMFSMTDEIIALQSALEEAEAKLRNESNDFEAAKMEMVRLEHFAEVTSKAVLLSCKAIQNGPPPNETQERAVIATPSRFTNPATAPTPKISNHKSSHQEASCDEPTSSDSRSLVKSNAFIRVHDLNIESTGAVDPSTGSPSFLFVDDNLKCILGNLAKLGLDKIRDESDRFKATRDTEKILSKYKKDGTATDSVRGNDVLVWMGDCGHKGHGNEWPVVKARGLIQTSPRELTDFLLDSSRIKEYNKMSQGRDDVAVFQQDLDTSIEESYYDVPGTARVLRSRNKPKLLPKAIEITSLMYAKQLEDSSGTYMLVNRSVFEDDQGTLKNNKNTITSEMLLGVNLIRPVDGSNTVSEFNSITHIFPPGVPEYLAKRVAPSSAVNMIKDLQRVFK